jgi:hypothetical protein
MTKPARCGCGAALVASLDWCPQCYRSPTPAPVADSPAEPTDDRPVEFVRERQGSPVSPRRAASPLRRWEASAVTFSLRGRILWTIVLTLPLLWFLYFLVPFGFVGLVTYGGAVYPRAMRDIWTRADRL